MIQFQSSVVAGTVLVRSAIQSPNYVAGVSGWTINQDGSVEFNNAVIRGSVEAGGGNVRLDMNGLRVLSTVFRFDINNIGGAIARRLPDDGAYAQLTMASLTPGSSFGGGVFLNPPSPTPNGNTYVSAGSMYVNTLTSGTVERGYTAISSPTLTGKTGSAMFFYGENSDSSFVPKIQMNSNLQLQADLSVDGIGHTEFYSFAGFTVTNSTTVVNISGTTLIIEAGHSYRIEVYASYDGPVAGDARWSWTKSSGLVTGARHIWAPAASTTNNTDTTGTAIRRADATQQITGTPAGNVNAFSVYYELGIWVSTSASDEAIQFQFAQGTANATGSTLQGGYIFLTKIA
jgi:hypothetical protein